MYRIVKKKTMKFKIDCLPWVDWKNTKMDFTECHKIC